MTDGPKGPLFIPRLFPDSALTGTESDVTWCLSANSERQRARDANKSTGREKRQHGKKQLTSFIIEVSGIISDIQMFS